MAQRQKVKLPPGLLQSLLYRSESDLKRLQQTNTHITKAKSENSIAVLEEEHSDAVMPSQVEVTESRKPIKKMINIHVGDAASTCRWDGLAILSLSLTHTLTHTHTHTHIYNESSEQCSPACCNCGVLGGGDHEVNMIQSRSFISLMKVITVCRDRQAARLSTAIHLPAMPLSLLELIAMGREWLLLPPITNTCTQANSLQDKNRYYSLYQISLSHRDL